MPTTPAPDRRLWCDRCGCVLVVTADELLQFSRGEWPRCCLVAMSVQVDDNSVNPSAGTEVERPMRQARKIFRG